MVCFDGALGSVLLYQEEKRQYESIVTAYPQKRLCEIYGAEHLLRLVAALPVSHSFPCHSYGVIHFAHVIHSAIQSSPCSSTLAPHLSDTPL